MKGTHVLTITAIYDYPSVSIRRDDAWEIWGTLDRERSTDARYIIPATYWTTDPMVADTAAYAMKTGQKVIVDWFDGGRGQHISGCELWTEARTA